MNDRYTLTQDIHVTMDIVPWLVANAAPSDRLLQLLEDRPDVRLRKLRHRPGIERKAVHSIGTSSFNKPFRTKLLSQDFAAGHFVGTDREIPIGGRYTRNDYVIIVDESARLDKRNLGILPLLADANVTLMFLDNAHAYLGMVPDMHVVTRTGLQDNVLEMSPMVESYLARDMQYDEIYCASSGEYFPTALGACPRTFFLEEVEDKYYSVEDFFSSPGVSSFGRDPRGSSLTPALTLAIVMGFGNIMVMSEDTELESSTLQRLVTGAHKKGIHITSVAANFPEPRQPGLYPSDLKVWAHARIERLQHTADIRLEYLTNTAAHKRLDPRLLESHWDDLIEMLPALNTILSRDARKEYHQKLEKDGSCINCIANAVLIPLLSAMHSYRVDHFDKLDAAWKELLPETTYYIFGGKKHMRLDYEADPTV